MTTHTTHCALRLGDNLAHLHFLRSLAQCRLGHQFIHYAHRHYLPQMIEVVCDLPNIQLRDLRYKPADVSSIDAWKNAGQFWETHDYRNDYAAFCLEFFAKLAGEMGLHSPFSKPSDLLFDYPALLDYGHDPIDVLVVNSPPLSSQWMGYDGAALDRLALDMFERGQRVVTTHPVRGLPCTLPNTVTAIGGVSIKAKCIVMVSTGPSWPTFNVWARDALRIVLIDQERIELTSHTEHCRTVDHAREILTAAEYL
jgi:hypothetical protein